MAAVTMTAGFCGLRGSQFVPCSFGNGALGFTTSQQGYHRRWHQAQTLLTSYSSASRSAFSPARAPQPSKQSLCKPSRKTTLSSVAVNAGESSEGGFLDTAILGALFGGWYAANIVFNIYNKQVLKVFPLPLTCTTVQFFVGALLAVACWTTGLIKRPKITAQQVWSILPLAVVHTLGNLLTNVSLGSVAVSFTHTIKAMEPIFSVALSALFLGEQPHPLVILSLVPIIAGVAMASVTEVTFNWTGFWSAMGSNLTFQSRNVLSKKMMSAAPVAANSTNNGRPAVAAKPLDNMNLFAIIQILSFFLLAPITLVREGLALTPSALSSLGIVEPNFVLTRILLAGLCFHLYQQVSYMILQRVSPVTHSVGNCVKRVVVIVASVIFFRNPMSAQNALGTGIALAGVFAYSQMKRLMKAQSTNGSVKAA